MEGAPCRWGPWPSSSTTGRVSPWTASWPVATGGSCCAGPSPGRWRSLPSWGDGSPACFSTTAVAARSTTGPSPTSPPRPTPVTVFLVGAGPGDPGLLTRRGAEVLARADVILFDRLVDPRLLELAPARARRIDVGKRPGQRRHQDEINALLLEHGRGAGTVVRLKGGDPFVFGRGGEEAEVLLAAGIAFEVVPGVTSAFAAPAAAGVPVTHRGLSSSVTVVSGHMSDPDAPGSVDWASLARTGGHPGRAHGHGGPGRDRPSPRRGRTQSRHPGDRRTPRHRPHPAERPGHPGHPGRRGPRAAVHHRHRTGCRPRPARRRRRAPAGHQRGRHSGRHPGHRPRVGARRRRGHGHRAPGHRVRRRRRRRRGAAARGGERFELRMARVYLVERRRPLRRVPARRTRPRGGSTRRRGWGHGPGPGPSPSRRRPRRRPRDGRRAGGDHAGGAIGGRPTETRALRPGRGGPPRGRARARRQGLGCHRGRRLPHRGGDARGRHGLGRRLERGRG